MSGTGSTRSGARSSSCARTGTSARSRRSSTSRTSTRTLRRSWLRERVHEHVDCRGGEDSRASGRRLSGLQLWWWPWMDWWMGWWCMICYVYVYIQFTKASCVPGAFTRARKRTRGADGKDRASIQACGVSIQNLTVRNKSCLPCAYRTACDYIVLTTTSGGYGAVCDLQDAYVAIKAQMGGDGKTGLQQQLHGGGNDDDGTGAGAVYERWKLPTPSRIATDSFSRMTAFEEYSGSLR